MKNTLWKLKNEDEIDIGLITKPNFQTRSLPPGGHPMQLHHVTPSHLGINYDSSSTTVEQGLELLNKNCPIIDTVVLSGPSMRWRIIIKCLQLFSAGFWHFLTCYPVSDMICLRLNLSIFQSCKSSQKCEIRILSEELIYILKRYNHEIDKHELY